MVIPDTTTHCTQSSEHDVRQVVKVVCKQQSFTVIPCRYHSQFQSLSSNPLASLNWDKMRKWVKSIALQYEKHNRFSQEGNVSDEEATLMEKRVKLQTMNNNYT